LRAAQFDRGVAMVASMLATLGLIYGTICGGFLLSILYPRF